MADSLGEEFQRAREARGLTLEEAASRTRILPRYLQAVEENNYAKLPDEVFTKGFVRTYARVLGLDESTVIGKFNESGGQFYAKQAERESLKQKVQEEARRKKINRNIVLVLVGVALLVLLVLMGRERQGPELSPAREPSLPAPGPNIGPLSPQSGAASPVDPTVSPRASSGPTEVERNVSGALPLERVVPDDKKLVLEIEAVERCWVLVQADHGPAQEVMLHPGDRFRWMAQEHVILTLGNAGGVRVYFDGKPQGPYGTRGQVVKDIVFSRGEGARPTGASPGT
jgi:cytoskeletal protein RodZ